MLVMAWLSAQAVIQPLVKRAVCTRGMNPLVNISPEVALTCALLALICVCVWLDEYYRHKPFEHRRTYVEEFNDVGILKGFITTRMMTSKGEEKEVLSHSCWVFLFSQIEVSGVFRVEVKSKCILFVNARFIPQSPCTKHRAQHLKDHQSWCHLQTR